MAFIETRDELRYQRRGEGDVRAARWPTGASCPITPKCSAIARKSWACGRSCRPASNGTWTKRRFELVTFVGRSRDLHSTLCSLAQGKALPDIIPERDVVAIARGDTPASLSPAEVVMVSFARAVARDASKVIEPRRRRSSASMASPMRKDLRHRRGDRRRAFPSGPN